MAIFTKAIIGSAVAGTIALGAMVTYDGGSTIDLAKDKITEAATQIGVFKQNETALVSKVTSLKNEKATLAAEVESLKVELEAEKAKNVTDNERIIQLEAEIAAKVAEIAELTAEIATLTADLENSAGNTAETVERINALEAELNAANAQAEELQYTLDETVLAEPDQAAVNAALEGTDGEVIIPDPPAGETKVAGAQDVHLQTGVPQWVSSDVKLNTRANGEVYLINNHETKFATAVVKGQTFTNISAAEVTIGQAADLHERNLKVTINGTDYNVWLTND